MLDIGVGGRAVPQLQTMVEALDFTRLLAFAGVAKTPFSSYNISYFRMDAFAPPESL
jgi:hypothetical protein